MSRVCEFCGKHTTTGHAVSTRGLAVHLGGVGIKCTGRSKRKYKANIQRVRAVVDGKVRRVKICTQCMRSGKLVKPMPTAVTANRV